MKLIYRSLVVLFYIGSAVGLFAFVCGGETGGFA